MADIDSKTVHMVVEMLSNIREPGDVNTHVKLEFSEEAEMAAMLASLLDTILMDQRLGVFFITKFFNWYMEHLKENSEARTVAEEDGEEDLEKELLSLKNNKDPKDPGDGITRH